MGGVAGHMAHLSEDTDLTFNEIISILSKVANAEIDNATEKVDGQNLFLLQMILQNHIFVLLHTCIQSNEHESFLEF